MTKERITLQRLRNMLSYAQQTGIFIRKVRAGRKLAGTVAGYADKTGYVRIGIDGISYHAHRLAWFYITEEWPDNIDHCDGNKHNNAWVNLRDVSRSVNLQNRKKATCRNKTGFLGVHQHGSGFAAAIRLNGRQTYIGTFKTPELAHAAYLEVKRQQHIGCTI